MQCICTIIPSYCSLSGGQLSQTHSYLHGQFHSKDMHECHIYQTIHLFPMNNGIIIIITTTKWALEKSKSETEKKSFVTRCTKSIAFTLNSEWHQEKVTATRSIVMLVKKNRNELSIWLRKNARRNMFMHFFNMISGIGME